MKFSTPWFKNSYLKSPVLKSSWLKSLGLKGAVLKLGVEKSGADIYVFSTFLTHLSVPNSFMDGSLKKRCPNNF